jgi:hypothetical protein
LRRKAENLIYKESGALKMENRESGNVIAFILVAIVLIGIVTAAIRGGGNEGGNIDKEQVLIKTTQLLQYAAELERGVQYMMQSGTVSESDIRFAHADAPVDYGNDFNINPQAQMFHRDGGGAGYRVPVGDINNGDQWEFYGHTALPGVGTDRADLIAVLPNLTQEACDKVNEMTGYEAVDQPEDNGAGGSFNCIYGGEANRFDDSVQFSPSPNTVDEASFTVLPASRACVKCSDDSLHFYQVILAR